jgi:hypothetical protein
VSDDATQSHDPDQVLVTVPKPFQIRLGSGHELTYVKAGVQRVSRALASHWYALANGVREFEEKRVEPLVAAGEKTVEELKEAATAPAATLAQLESEATAAAERARAQAEKLLATKGRKG